MILTIYTESYYLLAPIAIPGTEDTETDGVYIN